MSKDIGKTIKELEDKKRAITQAYVDGKISYSEYIRTVVEIDNLIRRLRES
jgi:hypothetical protein